MKTIRNRTMYLVLAMGIMVVGAALAFGSQLAQTTEVSPNSSATDLQKPEWKVGDWWIVEESERADWHAVANPPWIGPFKWKSEVIDVRSIDNEECFVVKSINMGSPESERIAYYRTENHSIVRIELLNPRRHRVYNEKDMLLYSSSPMPDKVPVFPAKTVVIPFGIPEIPNANATVDYTKVTYGKADAKCYRVDIGNGYQLWHPNAPWWLYHEKSIMKARLVDCSWWHE